MVKMSFKEKDISSHGSHQINNKQSLEASCDEAFKKDRSNATELGAVETFLEEKSSANSIKDDMHCGTFSKKKISCDSNNDGIYEDTFSEAKSQDTPIKEGMHGDTFSKEKMFNKAIKIGIYGGTFSKEKMCGKSIKIGIYGGTFSPVHLGHKKAADRFFDEFGLDKLLIMPTFIPPHKSLDYPDDPQKRLEMLHLAFEDDERAIEISDYEIKKEGKSYTVETLRHFKTPDTDIVFLMGTDMLLSFDKWYMPDEISRLASIAHVRRDELSQADEEKIRRAIDEYKERFGTVITELSCEPFPISSTDIRRMCKEDADIDEYVPKKVAEYIKENHLYGS